MPPDWLGLMMNESLWIGFVRPGPFCPEQARGSCKKAYSPGTQYPSFFLAASWLLANSFFQSFWHVFCCFPWGRQRTCQVWDPARNEQTWLLFRRKAFSWCSCRYRGQSLCTGPLAAKRTLCFFMRAPFGGVRVRAEGFAICPGTKIQSSTMETKSCLFGKYQPCEFMQFPCRCVISGGCRDRAARNAQTCAVAKSTGTGYPSTLVRKRSVVQPFSVPCTGSPLARKPLPAGVSSALDCSCRAFSTKSFTSSSLFPHGNCGWHLHSSWGSPSADSGW